MVSSQDNNVSFAELFEQSIQAMPSEGSVVNGTIKGMDGDFVLVDVGYKSDGKILLKEFSRGRVNFELNIGDTVRVYIDRYEDRHGDVVLSREKALREESWVDLEKSFEGEKQVIGVVTGRIKGGFSVDIEGVMAFLPGSQVDVRPVRDVTPLMGMPQPFKILKMDRLRGNIVVSRRAIIEEEGAEERAKVVSTLDEGQVVPGIVKNITNYGAFVDIGGVDGLLHNTDISWKRISHPSEVLEIGQQIQVKVIRFNRDTQRISLGLKQLDNDPWQGVETVFKSGDKISGTVTNITDYGIFVEVLPGVEGLVYISEISWKKNVHPNKVTSSGEKIDVVVLDVDSFKRRMSLGLKQLEENPWEKIAKDFPAGSEFESEINNITDFGLFIKITKDIDGMAHINDLSWGRPGEEAIKSYKRGDKITVKVLEVDVEKERVALGVKQLSEDPHKDTISNLAKGNVVTCVVKNILDSGIEVEFDNGMVGMIKKAELSKDKQDRRIDRFAVGEKVDAKVLSIDKITRKVLLSVRALEIEEEKRTMAEYGSADSGASLGDILGVAMNKGQ